MHPDAGKSSPVMKLLAPASTLGALLLHVLLGLMLWLFAKPHQLPDPPPVMQAVLMSAPPAGASMPAPQPAPAPEPAPAPRPEPKPVVPPQPKPERPKTETPKPQKPAPAKPEPAKTLPPKPTATPVETKKPVKPRLDDKLLEEELADVEAETSKARELAEKRQRDAEARQKALAAAMKAEADSMAAAAAADARARQMAAQIGEFTRAIDKKVKSAWRLPPNAGPGMTTEMRITILPGGEVASVLVTKSSGSSALDASAQEAVRRASPLPVPSDPTLFREQFKVLNLKLKSEE